MVHPATMDDINNRCDGALIWNGSVKWGSGAVFRRSCRGSSPRGSGQRGAPAAQRGRTTLTATSGEKGSQDDGTDLRATVGLGSRGAGHDASPQSGSAYRHSDIRGSEPHSGDAQQGAPD